MHERIIPARKAGKPSGLEVCRTHGRVVFFTRTELEIESSVPSCGREIHSACTGGRRGWYRGIRAAPETLISGGHIGWLNPYQRAI